MASYQDIEQRLRVVEDKLKFTMEEFKVGRVEGIVDRKLVTKSLYELYLEQVTGKELKGTVTDLPADIVTPEGVQDTYDQGNVNG